MMSLMRRQQYVYQPDSSVTSDEAIRHISRTHRVVEGAIDHTDSKALDEIEDRMPLPVRAIWFDVAQFRAYCSRFDYPTRFPGYYHGNTTEKAFEHFVSLQLLDPHSHDILLDIAAEGSPLRQIVPEHHGCGYYAQDIMYAAGINGCEIGGDAADMPLPNGSATLATITCSIEHFEGDSDIKAICELGRVLRPGGRFVIVPLYLWTYAAAQTDPCYAASAAVRFDDDVIVHCARGWRNRHGRFYSPETLAERILSCGVFDYEVYRIHGAPSAVYARWVLVGVRR